jgi:hypothetical protein
MVTLSFGSRKEIRAVAVDLLVIIQAPSTDLLISSRFRPRLHSTMVAPRSLQVPSEQGRPLPMGQPGQS